MDPRNQFNPAVLCNPLTPAPSASDHFSAPFSALTPRDHVIHIEQSITIEIKLSPSSRPAASQHPERSGSAWSFGHADDTTLLIRSSLEAAPSSLAAEFRSEIDSDRKSLTNYAHSEVSLQRRKAMRSKWNPSQYALLRKW